MTCPPSGGQGIRPCEEQSIETVVLEEDKLPPTLQMTRTHSHSVLEGRQGLDEGDPELWTSSLGPPTGGAEWEKRKPQGTARARAR